MSADLDPSEADLDPSEVGVDSAEGTRSATVPYMSFMGFRHLLDRLGNDGVPQVLDKSFFRQSSGSLVAQTRGTLKFFDLIDEDRRPTSALDELVNADESRRIEILRGLTEVKYADAIALGVNATAGQLAETFRSSGLTGSSLHKAMTFYVGLAEYVGLPLSPFFKQAGSRVSAGNGSSPRRTTRRRKPPGQPAAPSAPPPPAPPPIEVKQSAYIDLLMKLAESSAEKGDVQKDLLDRLELALGYRTSSETPRE
jgi:hypothetical protein